MIISKEKIIQRFVSYVTVDTESDPNNPAFPSTEKQWNLARILEKELRSVGLQNVDLDENCYLMATLPSNLDYTVPTIGFICSYRYQPRFYWKKRTTTNRTMHTKANEIVLNADQNIVLSPNYFEDLLQYKGQTLITTDGTTLLGADDKAGVTEIVSAMEYLVQHPEIKHGRNQNLLHSRRRSGQRSAFI